MMKAEEWGTEKKQGVKNTTASIVLRGKGAGEEGDEARDPQIGAKTLNKRIKLKTPLAIVLLL